MSGKRAKFLRKVAQNNMMSERVTKRLYKSLPKPKKLQFIKVGGQLIFLSNSYLASLRLNINPPVGAASRPQDTTPPNKNGE